MVSVEHFSRLVSGIYAAAVTPQHWEQAIRDIHRALGGTGGALTMGGGAVWSVLNTSMPAEAAKSYVEHYSHLDHVLDAVEKGPIGALRTGTELIAPTPNSEFHTDWIRPNDVEDGLFVRLTGGPRPVCFIVAAPRRTESFETSDRVKLMGALVPHLQQALRTQNKLAALAHSTIQLTGALDVVRRAVVVVREHLVINLNSAAERIFRAEDGLCMRSRRIAATSSHTERELHHAIQNAVTDEHSTIRKGRSLTCARPSGKRPYVIHVLPSRRPDADEPLRQRMAVVLIIDPEDESEPTAALGAPTLRPHRI